MPTEADLISQLVDAHRSGTHTIDPTPYAELDRAAAYRVQIGTMRALGATPAMLKTAVHPDGVGVAAPIFNLGQAPSAKVQVTNVVGLELEVGLVLASDVPDGITDDAELVEAIDHYFVGIEICGSRFTDRAKAGLVGGLADNMSAHSYVLNPMHRDPGADIHGYDVQLEFAGAQIFSGPAKHSFGTVLNSFVAYAKNQNPAYPLKAGTVITTGSLCGLVPTTGTGHVVGRLGNHTVEFDIV